MIKMSKNIGFFKYIYFVNLYYNCIVCFFITKNAKKKPKSIEGCSLRI
jgi:hypothetical protein